MSVKFLHAMKRKDKSTDVIPPKRLEKVGLALLSGDARRYILERCSPIDFLCDVVNGDLEIEVTARTGKATAPKVVGYRKPSMSERMTAALALAHKVLPDLKTIEARVPEQSAPGYDLTKLSEADLLALERIASKTIPT